MTIISFRKCVKAFIKDSNGATAVEYGLVLTLIAILAAGAFGAMGSNLSNHFNNTANNLDDAG